MITAQLVDHGHPRRKCRRILDQVCASRIVYEEKVLLSAEDVARLSIKNRVRPKLKPAGVIEMGPHEHEREETNAQRYR